MINLACKVPNKLTVACSGGPDSMVAVDFFLRGKKEVQVAYFDHGTEHGFEAKKFVESFCREKNLKFITASISREKKPNESPEEYWRNERLKWLHSIPHFVATGHHLDDAVEWWIFTALHGYSKLIPIRNRNIIRPFLLTPKTEIIDWAQRKKVPYVDDPSNQSLKYSRNKIRHLLLPEAFKVNPGLRTVVRKKMEEKAALLNIKDVRPVC